MNLSRRFSSSDALCFSPDDEADFFMIDAYLSSSGSTSNNSRQPAPNPPPQPQPQPQIINARQRTPEDTRDDFRPVHVPKYQGSGPRTSALTTMIAAASGPGSGSHRVPPSPRAAAHVHFRDSVRAMAEQTALPQQHPRSNSIGSVDSVASASLFRDVPSRSSTPARARGGGDWGLFSMCSDGAMAAMSRAMTNLVAAARTHRHPQPL
jgi:hypothetical protein